MPTVKHLPLDFYTRFTTLMNKMHDVATFREYSKIYGFLKTKDFVGATDDAFGAILATRDRLSCSQLNLMRKDASDRYEFYRELNKRIDDYNNMRELYVEWITLITNYGGPEQVTELAKRKQGRLPMRTPVKVLRNQ